jgi:hypothetical protein
MDPDPTPDQTPFFIFIDFKDTKKYIFFTIFFITCLQAHHLQSEKFNFLLEFYVKILFCGNYFSQLNIFMRKGKDPEPDPGGIKTCGSGSGSPTLVSTFLDLHDLNTAHSIRRWAGFGIRGSESSIFSNCGSRSGSRSLL